MADFYVRAGRALQDILSQRGSVKAVSAHNDARGPNDAKRVMALVVNTLSFRDALQQVLSRVDVAAREPKWFGRKSPLNRAHGAEESRGPPLAACVLLLLVHDLLFAQRGIQAAKAWPPRVCVERHKSQLRAELVRVQLRHGKSRAEDLRSGERERRIAARIPRWCRVNTLKISVDDALQALQELGWELHNGPTVSNEKHMVRSSHVRGILALHPRSTSKLIGSRLYKDGCVVLQDLASCFPAEVLDPLQFSPDAPHALDATAAPGNKTSHLSALMHGRGSIIALERAPARYQTLTRLLGRAGCLAGGEPAGNVQPRKQDFLAVDPAKDGCGVQFLLLDPSCSGSGIANRLDYLSGHGAVDSTFTVCLPADDEQDNLEQVVPDQGSSEQPKASTRLEALASLQVRMIRHAMQFPDLQRFTYSTCSIHEEENEQVVCQVLASDEAKKYGWRLAPREQVIPSWKERGHASACGGDAELAGCMVRCTPGGTVDCPEGTVHEDATNGFFVSCFMRNDTAKRQPEPKSSKAKRRKKGGD